MKAYLVTTFLIALLISTAFILLVSDQNLGEDFYGTTIENGVNIERPKIDQFALYIASWTVFIFTLFAAPVLVFHVFRTVFRMCRLVVRKLK